MSRYTARNPTARSRRDAVLAAVLAVAGIGVWGPTGSASAQTQITPPPPTVSTTNISVDPTGADPGPYVSDREYRLAPDDAIEITVVDHANYNFSAVVMPNGTIKYPRLKRELKVAGMTTAELEKIVTRSLDGGGNRKKAYLINPQVQVYVRSRQLRTVSVLGTAARSPGKTALKEGWRMFDLIAAIGGVPSDRLEYYDVQLIRGGDNMRPVNLPALYRLEPQENILLRPDDIVLINAQDESKTTLQVIGEVAKPGPLVVPRDGSLATILGQVQPNPLAQLSAAKIQRNGEDIPLDLSRWFKDGKLDDAASRVKVQPGDRLIIPQNKRLYSIYGPIGRSGTQVYPDDRRLTIITALSDAGGNTEGLELKDVRVIRKDPSTGTATMIKVDVKEMLAKGDLSRDIPIYPGDLIYVPAARRGKGLNLGQVFGFLGLIPTLDYLFRR
ncbi:MAG: polysaccharide biosynthesis/export family protein [Cytophagales bacterium]|nr:polysaccharide biosynthesis/export family protein [Armatimonadota bacterium]